MRREMKREMKNARLRIGAAALSLLLALTLLVGCTLPSDISDVLSPAGYTESAASSAKTTDASGVSAAAPVTTPSVGAEKGGEHSGFDPDAIPPYSGSVYITVCDGIPDFSDDELTAVSFEQYAELDSLGRCGVCTTSVGRDIMPTVKRGSIGQVKPTGWHTVKYDFVDGKYLYNRCHLIGFQLTGENANTRNLITGTRYLNVEGMLPFENMVADYVKETDNHVMYRVTPVFIGDELLARGVHIEALSVEDDGDGICFNVYCYNVQPGVSLDYATGESEAERAA